MTGLALAAFLAAQIADVLSTIRGMERGAKEGNPLVRWLMDKLGRWWWVGKLVPSLGIGLALYAAGATYALFGLAAAFAGIAIWNSTRGRK